MASKNLGAVIQRAISDGAFRRQLQSDPAAALRGFNLSPDEIAAVRSGDSSKLMSLGVDQRMSKAFTLGGLGSQATRAAMSGDVTGSTSSVLAGDSGSGAREGFIGDPTTGVRAANSGGDLSGAHASVSTPQSDAYRSVNDPDNAGSTRASVSTPQSDAYRSVNDPDNAGSTRASVSGQLQDSPRAINDPDNAGSTRETVSGQLQDSPRAINDPDNNTVSSHMQDANAGLPGGDAQHDPGFVDTHSTFVPSDSADVQHELLDSQQHGTGDALGNTGTTGDEHSWG